MCKKEDALMAFIEPNFSRVLAEETKQTLGDRSQYIGASDIGGCPFKTVMSKKNPSKNSLKQQIVYQRGHLAEDIVSKMLDGLNYEDQVEVIGQMEKMQLKAHLDKLIKSSNRCVVLEVKTVSAPIDEPYESWILQVQFQMGLMMEKCGHEIEGYVLALNLNTGWIKPFYMEFNDDLFNMCLNKAQHIEDALMGLVEPKAIVQYYCSACPYKMVCPKQGKFAQELPKELLEDLRFIKEAKKVEKEAKERKERVKEFLVSMGIEAGKDDVSQTVVTVRKQNSTRLDTWALRQSYPEIYKKFLRENSSHRLNVI